MKISFGKRVGINTDKLNHCMILESGSTYLENVINGFDQFEFSTTMDQKSEIMSALV